MLQEILLDVTVGLSKTDILALTLLHSQSHNTTYYYKYIIHNYYDNIFNVRIYFGALLLPFFLRVQIEYECAHAHALFFPSVTLSFPYSKSFKEHQLFICASYNNLKRRLPALILWPYPLLEGIKIQHWNLRAALKLMQFFVLTETLGSQASGCPASD